MNEVVISGVVKLNGKEVLVFSYFLRHFLVWLRAKGRVGDFNGEFETSLRSWFTDCDLNFHVNNARYMVFMEVARFDLSLRSGLISYCVKNKIAPMLMGSKITFRREIKPFRKINIKTKIIGYDDKFIIMEQKMVSARTLHSKGYVRVGFYKKGGFIKPEDLLSTLNLDFVQEPLSEEVRLWLASEDLLLKSIKT